MFINQVDRDVFAIPCQSLVGQKRDDTFDAVAEQSTATLRALGFNSPPFFKG